MDHHLVSEMSNVLERVPGSGVVVQGWSCELLRELALQNFFTEGGFRDFDTDFQSATEL